MKRGLGQKFLKKASRDRELVQQARAAKELEVNMSVTDLTFKEYIEVVMPTFKFYAWNLILIERLQEVADGKLSRLLVQCPPRHGKSELAKLFAGYYLLRYQNRFVGVSSYPWTWPPPSRAVSYTHLTLPTILLV